MRIRPMAASLTLATAIVTPLAAVSPAQAAAVPSMIYVSPDIGWRSYHFYVTDRQKLRFTYAGPGWSVDGDRYAPVGPRGYDAATDSRIWQGCKYKPDAPYGSLMYMTGREAKTLGETWTVRPAATGWMKFQLRINDGDNCLKDNSGYLRFRITVIEDGRRSDGGNGGAGRMEPGIRTATPGVMR